MQERYRLYQRTNGIFYVEDIATKKQETLKTRYKADALGLLAARNQSREMPDLNLAMARRLGRARS